MDTATHAHRFEIWRYTPLHSSSIVITNNIVSILYFQCWSIETRLAVGYISVVKPVAQGYRYSFSSDRSTLEMVKKHYKIVKVKNYEITLWCCQTGMIFPAATKRFTFERYLNLYLSTWRDSRRYTELQFSNKFTLKWNETEIIPNLSNLYEYCYCYRDIIGDTQIPDSDTNHQGTRLPLYLSYKNSNHWVFEIDACAYFRNVDRSTLQKTVK